METKEFLNTYWKYFLNLENDFLATEKFVAIDKVNEKTYSFEYLKLFQIICAEIDVVAKVFCKEIDTSFNKDKMPHYNKTLTRNIPDFKEKEIIFKINNKALIPWTNWDYTESIDAKGVTKITGSGPIWWATHNKVKHSRTLVESTEENYKKANQKNVILSLAGLYQLEMYFYRHLAEKEKTVFEVPLPKSRLFTIPEWDKNVMAGDAVVFTVTDTSLSIDSIK